MEIKRNKKIRRKGRIKNFKNFSSKDYSWRATNNTASPSPEASVSIKKLTLESVNDNISLECDDILPYQIN